MGTCRRSSPQRGCLTEAERENVVAKAQALFQHCLNIVMEIDTVVSSYRPRPAVGFRCYNLLTFYLRLLVTILILGGVVCVL